MGVKTGELSQREVGELLGISQAMVNKIEARALRKIREAIETDEETRQAFEDALELVDAGSPPLLRRTVARSYRSIPRVERRQ